MTLSSAIRQELNDSSQYLPLEQWQSGGALLKTLAGAVVDYDVLTLGNRMSVFIPELLSGMKITSQLIHSVDDEVLMKQLKVFYANDIRLTPHCQDYAEFIGDIKHHTFDLIVLGFYDDEMLPTAFSMLNDNGLLCLFSEAVIDLDTIKVEQCNASLLEGGHVLLLTKQREKPMRRRSKKTDG